MNGFALTVDWLASKRWFWPKSQTLIPVFTFKGKISTSAYI